MDAACVGLNNSDGTVIAIATIAVENEVADNMNQCLDLDWLVYNKPLEYSGEIYMGTYQGVQSIKQ